MTLFWWHNNRIIRGQMIKYCKNNIADDDICQNVSEFPLFCYKSIIVRAFLNSVLKYIESYVNINSFVCLKKILFVILNVITIRI